MRPPCACVCACATLGRVWQSSFWDATIGFGGGAREACVPSGPFGAGSGFEITPSAWQYVAGCGGTVVGRTGCAIHCLRAPVCVCGRVCECVRKLEGCVCCGVTLIGCLPQPWLFGVFSCTVSCTTTVDLLFRAPSPTTVDFFCFVCFLIWSFDGADTCRGDAFVASGSPPAHLHLRHHHHHPTPPHTPPLPPPPPIMWYQH